MSHNHVIKDTDLHFIIDPITRTIESQSDKRFLTQLDHESERLTIGIPLTVEGHDMSECDRIEIHFTNISKKKDKQSDGVYIIKDSDRASINDLFLFSWKVRRESTLHAGSLRFSITFLCHDEEGKVTYEWSTTEYKYIQILPRLDHTISDIVNYPDLYEQFKKELFEEYQLDENEVNVIIAKYLETNPIETVTSWNDLEDKPFYEYAEEKVISPTTTYQCTYQAKYYGSKIINYQSNLIAGNTYKVIYNGDEYILKAKLTIDDTSPYLGNLKYCYNIFWGSYDSSDTGEPFLIVNQYDTDRNEPFMLFRVPYGTENVELSITEISEVIVQLDEKYIPDTIAKKSDMPCYTEYGTVQTIREFKTGTMFIDGNSNPDDMEFVQLVLNNRQTTTFNIDGITYTYKEDMNDAPEEITIWIVVSEDGVELTICIAYNRILVLPQFNDTCVIAVTHNGIKEIHQVDPKYIKDMYYDTSNRVYVNESIDVDSAKEVDEGLWDALITGNHKNILLDEYHLEMLPVEDLDMRSFSVHEYRLDVFADSHIIGLKSTGTPPSEPKTCIISGYYETGELKQIDEKYIPTVSNEEVLEMLLELDVIDAVTDENGLILTDENNNILLW